MPSQNRDIVVIGGGPAGLAAAIAARKQGCRDVLLIERDTRLGGVLNQCIHDGFGLHRFKEALSGPEYAHRFMEELKALGIETMLNSIVLSIDRDRTMLVSSPDGSFEIKAKAVILAMGCRERTAGAISLPGTRPAGIYTAGAAQHFINLQNIMVGRRIVILGSGDIGMIMARRLTLEGAKIEGVFEIMPYASGLARNIQQCLNDFGIPLHLGTSVVQIHGSERLEGVTVAQVDESYKPVPGTERFIACDTLLLSVGLIPENELSRGAGVEIAAKTSGAVVDDSLMTSVEGVFACGNVLHVHDLVDFVSEEAEKAGVNAVRYIRGELPPPKYISIEPGSGVRYVLPQTARHGESLTISLRVTQPGREQAVWVRSGGKKIIRKKHMRLHPAEMIRIKLPASKLEGIDSLEVSVE
ncbi:MAG: NAD(P)/FAD-dependent oxidoreductase [Syntrophobacteraceae bacterium]